MPHTTRATSSTLTVPPAASALPAQEPGPRVLRRPRRDHPRARPRPQALAPLLADCLVGVAGALLAVALLRAVTPTAPAASAALTFSVAALTCALAAHAARRWWTAPASGRRAARGR